MSQSAIDRRALLAGLAVFAAPGLPLDAAAALEPLEIVTAKGRTTFMVEIADDDRERAQGLMYRRSLAADRGMLFDFKTERSVSFWMRNTYIPLDMIFIRADGTILNIHQRAIPRDETGIRATLVVVIFGFPPNF